MYVSDYGFAAAPSAWTTILSSYNNSSITSVNWMYMGLYEWTMARRSDDSYGAFNVVNDGSVYFSAIFYRAVRPVLYLASETAYVSGSGTISSPILLS